MQLRLHRSQPEEDIFGHPVDNFDGIGSCCEYGCVRVCVFVSQIDTRDLEGVARQCLNRSFSSTPNGASRPQHTHTDQLMRLASNRHVTFAAAPPQTKTGGVAALPSAPLGAPKVSSRWSTRSPTTPPLNSSERGQWTSGFEAHAVFVCSIVFGNPSDDECV